MTSYADYEFYKDTYLGTAIREEDFPRLALRASGFLDYYTQGRAAGNAGLQAVKMACCAVAEQYQIIESAGELARNSLFAGREASGSEVQSESVGSWSRSYRSGGESAAAAAAAAAAGQSALASAARMYLQTTGLLYRGMRCMR